MNQPLASVNLFRSPCVQLSALKSLRLTIRRTACATGSVMPAKWFVMLRQMEESRHPQPFG